jgi:hypothetical protein
VCVLSVALPLGLGGCDDTETTMAKCRLEAMRALGSAATNQSALGSYIRSCMVVAGYAVSESCTDASISAQWLECYEPKGVIAKLSNAGKSKR